MSPMNIYDIIRSGIFRERIKHICTYFSRPKHKMYQPSLKETVTIWANDYGRQKKKNLRCRQLRAPCYSSGFFGAYPIECGFWQSVCKPTWPFWLMPGPEFICFWLSCLISQLRLFWRGRLSNFMWWDGQRATPQTEALMSLDATLPRLHGKHTHIDKRYLRKRKLRDHIFIQKIISFKNHWNIQSIKNSADFFL